MSEALPLTLPGVTPRDVPRVLSIAGSDPSGGAGIQADLKSITARGGYGMCAITALTAQNTRGVTGVHTPPAKFLREQLEAVSTDISIDAVKIGMLSTSEVIDTVRVWLGECRPPVTVLDPVMVATSGDRLLDSNTEDALAQLLPLATVITPNISELAALAGTFGGSSTPATCWEDALAQGCYLAEHTGTRVLVKGGHLPGGICRDALIAPDLADPLWEGQAPTVESSNTHGTGCSLSSALATELAKTGNWATALSAVKTWLTGAIRSADTLEVGQGNGPIHHFHHIQHPSTAN